MALRLLEVDVPADALDGLAAVLEDVRVIHLSTSAPAGGMGLARILVDAVDSEAASDKLVSRYGAREGFRLISVAVEASLPAVETPEKPEKHASADVPRDAPERSGPKRISREELYGDIAEAGRLTRIYLVMVALSTIVAAIGLIRGDVAIIIGAMVIAPLLGPNIAFSLAATLGDPDLARRSLLATSAGVATAAVISIALGALVHIDPSAAELAGRTHANIGDVALALSAGSAGALAFTTGVPAVVVGVMVAVALLPPLVAAGLLAGAGYWSLAGSALVLALTNVTCINLAAVATFLAQRVRPRSWWEAERARRATRIAVATWALMLAVLISLMLTGLVGGL